VVSIQLEATVEATSKSARVRETLPTVLRVLDLYEKHLTDIKV
jgi:hypothetical protein